MKSYLSINVLILFLPIVMGCISNPDTAVQNSSRVETKLDSIFTVNEIDKSGRFKIMFVGDNTDYNKANYPLKYFGTKPEPDTLSMIRNLLEFEGDQRLCYVPLKNFNLLSSTAISGNYTIEVEALFLVNQLYFGEDFKNYSPYARLRSEPDCNLGSEEIVKHAYDAYRKWFKAVEKMGLAEARSAGIKPLKETCIGWM